MKGLRFAASMFVPLAAVAAQEAAGFRWHDDLATARRIAHDQHRPLLLLFRCER